MFTGIIEAIGEVRSVTGSGDSLKVEVFSPEIASSLRESESISISGACVTVVKVKGDSFSFDLVEETLRRTTLAQLAPGVKVNLERSLRPSDRMGGHWVTGHIDGLGRIARISRKGPPLTMTVSCSREIGAGIVEKGSVAVDGVSLTAFDVSEEEFSFALIPYTLSHTTLGLKRPGELVNIETDILGKFVRKALEKAGLLKSGGLSQADLEGYGYE